MVFFIGCHHHKDLRTRFENKNYADIKKFRHFPGHHAGSGSFARKNSKQGYATPYRISSILLGKTPAGIDRKQ
jgi:hypothetical protein